MYFGCNNQRSYHRMQINMPVMLTKNAQSFKATCVDLSSTGMRVEYTHTVLEMGDTVHVKLATDDERFPPLNAHAKLIRVKEKEGFFSAAVEFIELA